MMKRTKRYGWCAGWIAAVLLAAGCGTSDPGRGETAGGAAGSTMAVDPAGEAESDGNRESGERPDGIADDLRDGADTLEDGADTLKDGVENLKDGAERMKDDVKDSVGFC